MNRFSLRFLAVMLLLAFALPATSSAITTSIPPQVTNSNNLPISNHLTQSTTAETNGWTIECVDCPKQFSLLTDHSLQLDSLGYPHIAYGGDHLYYATYDGADWVYETVDESDSVGGSAALVFDKDGSPHISYLDYDQASLKYAYKKGADWEIQTIDQEVDYWNPTAISLDSDGHPHISYTGIRYCGDWNGPYICGSRLKYAHNDGARWTIKTLDDTNCISLSMTLDVDGSPHIVYSTYNGLKYLYLDETSWHGETIPGEGTGISIALDQNGGVHFSFRADDSLSYAFRDSAGWKIQQVESFGNEPEDGSGGNTSIALDVNANPRISYRFNDKLKYAKGIQGGWEIDEINTLVVDYEYHFTTSLALDNAGHPNIVYLDAADLKYTYSDSIGWQHQTVDYEGSAGWDHAMVMDESGSVYISYLNYAEEGLIYASNQSGSWEAQTILNDVGINISMALDQHSYPHISFNKGPDYARTYTYQDDTGWHSEIVDYAMNYEGALILDDSGQPHILYNKAESGPKYYYDGMVHAYKLDGNWQMDWIGGTGNSITPAWDEQGLHIAYEAGGLYYDEQLIDSEAVGGVSLVLDRNGNPHLSYVAWYEDHYVLRYAYQEQIVTLDGIGTWNTSLALDSDGYPHISYTGEGTTSSTGYGLKYVYRDITGWHFRLIYSGMTGDHSLVLDSNDRPHISYHDGNPNDDLRYTFHLDPFHELSLSPLEDWKSGLPGTTIIYTLQLTNTGQVSDTFQVSASDSSWNLLAPATIGPLEAAESASIDISVSIPAYAPMGVWDVATIKVTSLADSSQSANAKLITQTGDTLLVYLPILQK